MNFGTMQTALLRYGFDVTDPIATWLNASKNDFAMEADWTFLEEGPVTVTMASGNTITLPSDIQKIITLKDNTNLCKLEYWSRRKFTRYIRDETETGYPEVYTLVGTNQIQLWRTPTTSINYQVLYQAISPDMVNAGDMPLSGSTAWPVATHYPLVVRAAAMALMAENEEDRAKVALGEYQSMMTNLLARFTDERELDDVDSVQDVQGYGNDVSSVRRSY